MKHTQANRHYWTSLSLYLFQVSLVSLIMVQALELLLPGSITLSFDPDLFLWPLLGSGLAWLVLRPRTVVA